ncbi:MAG: hypothetical protein K2X82_09595 [Gemmataceae bacterium]|nr:hypothetical protein [Gemmataceae bacterium]
MDLIDKAELARRLGKSARTVDRMRWRYELYEVGPGYPRFLWDRIRRDIEAGAFPRRKENRRR